MQIMTENFKSFEKESDNISEHIRIDISQRKLWEEFHKNINEMILTNKGRCVYPRIGYFVKGLEPETTYAMCLKLSRADRFRYKYTAGEWHIAGAGDLESDAKVIHSDNGWMQIGQYWMNNGIRFGKLKITNNIKDCSATVPLKSMHKYRPVLFIYKVYATPALCLDGSSILTNQYQLIKTYSNEVMEFVAVTAYQNQRIIEMKKMHNSYARGQRGSTIRNNVSLTTDRNDAVAQSEGPSIHFSLSSLNRYQPYWTNESHHFSNPKHSPHSVHLPFLACQPPINRSIQISSPKSSNSSQASPNNFQSCSDNSKSSFRSSDDPAIIPHATRHKSVKPKMQPFNIAESPGFSGLNLSTMWNYGTLWHPFPMSYTTSFIPHNNQFLDSNI